MGLPAGIRRFIISPMSAIQSFHTKPKLLYAQVALPVPVNNLFTYSIPHELISLIFAGCRVEVPFGRRILTGMVAEVSNKTSVKGIKAIRRIVDPALSGNLMKLSEWMAGYYGCSLGEAAQAVLPAGMKKLSSPARLSGRVEAVINRNPGGIEMQLKKTPRQLGLFHALVAAGGAADLEDVLDNWGFSRNILKELISKGFAAMKPRLSKSALDAIDAENIKLNPDQEKCVNEIISALDGGGFASFLLHGITGSGKTEIYIRAAEHVLSRGGGCIIMVPEIGLLPQAVARYKKVFGVFLEVIHSRLSRAKRYEIWKKAESGECRLVLGPRSAVFSPVNNLSLIIVDEEQDGSYKQNDKPRYHARSVAMMRGKFEDLAVVLGSATPSAESFHNASRGRYSLLSLPKRVGGASLPVLRVVDMRSEDRENGFFSRLLLDKLDRCISGGGQCILFYNKRGHARFMRCNSCGWTARCENCDISLVYHRVGRSLRCHYCGAARAAPAQCPECRGADIFFAGTGTQRVEIDLAGLFPGAGMLRMDADTTSGREGHQRILEKFGTGNYPILLGTQMVTKGHHFPGVGLVGVLSAEEELNFPDFRSAERAFQQLMQVSGRAGRSGRRGEVIIQTYIPEHNVFNYLIRHDFTGFMREELLVRKKLGYPPYTRLISAICSGTDRRVLQETAAKWAGELRGTMDKSVNILGPVPPLIERLKGRYRQQVLLKGRLTGGAKQEAQNILQVVKTRIKGGGQIELRWDVDPESFS